MNEKKLQAINAYLLLCRSNEEISLLKKDAENCVAYYQDRKESINKSIEVLTSNSALFAKGCISLLHSELTLVEKFLRQSYCVMDQMASDDFRQALFDEEEDSSNDEEETADKLTSDEL